jgi:hypothetical protein
MSTEISQTSLHPAAVAERERFKSVMSCATYRGREAAAARMLLDTGMTAKQICDALAGLAGPAEPAGEFEQGKKIAAGLPADMRRAD